MALGTKGREGFGIKIPILMRTLSEKSGCKPRFECQHMELQIAMHPQQARAQNKLHKGLETNVCHFWPFQVELRMVFDLQAQYNGPCALVSLSYVLFGMSHCNS